MNSSTPGLPVHHQLPEFTQTRGHRDRARVAEESAAAAARRSHERARRRERAHGPGGARDRDGRAHDDRDRAPAGHRAARRPHRRPRGRTDRRRRSSRRTGRAWRVVRPARGDAVRHRRRRTLRSPLDRHRMNAMPYLHRRAAALVLVCALAGCVAYPYPDAVPVTTMTPPDYDRSWDAAIGAAADAGVQLTSTDRARGRIAGSRSGTAVTIEGVRLADGKVRVGFTSDPKSQALNDQWLAAYQRRMGR